MVCSPIVKGGEQDNRESVTVLIVNWNSGELLDKCLKHLIEQTIMPEKIIVIDNASIDNSIENVETYKNIVLRKINSNLGFAAGNNRAIEECDTEWVALLNPDAFPEPDWLEALIIATRQYPDIIAFGCRQLCQDNLSVIDGVGDVYHVSGSVWREHHGLPQQSVDLVSKEIFSPCAAAALYKRQELIELGGFDEDYFCYLEDVDLGFRLRLAGFKAMCVSNAVVHHVGSASTGGQHSDFSIYHGHRNLVWTYIKNMPGFLFWLLLPLHFLLNIVTIILFMVRGKFKVILRSKWDAIKGVPCMWAKRKQIQRDRKVTITDIWRVLDKHFFR